MILRNNFILIIMLVLISGCVSSGSRFPVISENEVYEHEKKLLAEYEALKTNHTDRSVVKWIQPANKRETCKIFFRTHTENDRTINPDYKIFWDGDCKNGYAYGLGREFERGSDISIDAIAVYQGGPVEPKYYIQKNNLDNVTIEGDINNKYVVGTKINDDKFDFDIAIRYGRNSNGFDQPALYIETSPFSGAVKYDKIYPNFRYSIFDGANDELSDTNIGFSVVDNNGNGFYKGAGFYKGTDINSSWSYELKNGKPARLVTLPRIFIKNIDSICNEVKQAGQLAKDAQERALRIKKQYVAKVCKESVKVDFLDNEEYKKICNESDYYTKLKVKFDAKMVQINQQKQQKREQLLQQQQLNAQQQQQNQQAALNDFANSMLELGKTARQAGSQALQNSNSFSYPSVMPLNINPLNGTKIRNCYTVSGIEFCR
jgi:hypothetical protein